jgi:hypothetical protein
VPSSQRPASWYVPDFLARPRRRPQRHCPQMEAGLPLVLSLRAESRCWYEVEGSEARPRLALPRVDARVTLRLKQDGNAEYVSRETSSSLQCTPCKASDGRTPCQHAPEQWRAASYAANDGSETSRNPEIGNRYGFITSLGDFTSKPDAEHSVAGAFGPRPATPGPSLRYCTAARTNRQNCRDTGSDQVCWMGCVPREQPP